MQMTPLSLVLQDGTTFTGNSFGAEIEAHGEVVFNTGMMGYPESFTDPSYEGQIIVLTYPLIGNYGVPNTKAKDENGLLKFFESDKIHIKGLIVSEYSNEFSHHEAKKSLADWLKENNIPAIEGIDTRALTQKLRNHGVMLGTLSATKVAPRAKEPLSQKTKISIDDPNASNLVAEVSIKKPITYKSRLANPKRIVAVDCGMKNNILRNLLKRNLEIIRVPWDYDFIANNEIENVDGIFLSNGPGDPATLTTLHETIRKAMAYRRQKKPLPIFGICLGNQVLAIASGAKTYKLKFGHRAQNQPVIDVDPSSPNHKHCYITSQNHGFAIDEKTLPKNWIPWLRNLNDDSNEGIRHTSLPFFSCQFHPEATPGPTDTEIFFDKFVEML